MDILVRQPTKLSPSVRRLRHRINSQPISRSHHQHHQRQHRQHRQHQQVHNRSIVTIISTNDDIIIAEGLWNKGWLLNDMNDYCLHSLLRSCSLEQTLLQLSSTETNSAWIKSWLDSVDSSYKWLPRTIMFTSLNSVLSVDARDITMWNVY